MAGQLQGSGLLPPYTGVDKQYLLHGNASLFCELQDSLPQFYQNIRIRQVTRQRRSVFAEQWAYRQFQSHGSLWVESYTCRFSWLAELICGDLLALEGDGEALGQGMPPPPPPPCGTGGGRTAGRLRR